jgi:hypothetical protein
MNRSALTDEQLNKLALDDERFDAHFIASLCKTGRSQRLLEILAAKDPRKFQLVADALKGKRTFQLNTTGAKIMRAYIAAEWACGRRRFDGTHEVWDTSVRAPTMFEIRAQYAKLFVKEQQPHDQIARSWLRRLVKRNKIPQDVTFQRTLKRCDADFTLENPHAAD